MSTTHCTTERSHGEMVTAPQAAVLAGASDPPARRMSRRAVFHLAVCAPVIAGTPAHPSSAAVTTARPALEPDADRPPASQVFEIHPEHVELLRRVFRVAVELQTVDLEGRTAVWARFIELQSFAAAPFLAHAVSLASAFRKELGIVGTPSVADCWRLADHLRGEVELADHPAPRELVLHRDRVSGARACIWLRDRESYESAEEQARGLVEMIALALCAPPKWMPPVDHEAPNARAQRSQAEFLAHQIAGAFAWTWFDDEAKAVAPAPAPPARPVKIFRSDVPWPHAVVCKDREVLILPLQMSAKDRAWAAARYPDLELPPVSA